MTSGRVTPTLLSGFSMAWCISSLLLLLISLSLIGCTREIVAEVPVEVVVEKEVIREVPVEVVVVKEVIREVPVEVVVVKEVVKEVERPRRGVVEKEVIKEVEVPVEVVVVKEVIKEVEVVVTPTPASQEPLQSLSAPDIKSNIGNVLLVRPGRITYSHLPALGFSEGIPVTAVTGAAGARDIYEADGVDLDHSKIPRCTGCSHTTYPFTEEDSRFCVRWRQRCGLLERLLGLRLADRIWIHLCDIP